MGWWWWDRPIERNCSLPNSIATGALLQVVETDWPSESIFIIYLLIFTAQETVLTRGGKSPSYLFPSLNGIVSKRTDFRQAGRDVAGSTVGCVWPKTVLR